MTIFIFSYLDHVTNSYHSGGGLAIIAESLDAAKDIVKSIPEVVVTDDDWNLASVYELDPNIEYQPKAWIFPDAGCC